jgi:hypothetical protein
LRATYRARTGQSVIAEVAQRELSDYDRMFRRRHRRAGRLMTTKASSRNVSAELAFLARALKAPSLAAAVERLGERAWAESWTHDEFLAACLQREVSARESHGGEGRIRTARFPARKSLEEFDYEHQRS